MISFHLLQTKLAWQVSLKLRSLNIFSSNSGGKMLIIVGIERFFIMAHNLSFWLLSCPEKIASANVLKLVKASLKSLEFILRVGGGSVQSTPHGRTTLIEIYIIQIYTKFNLQYHNLQSIWSYYKWIYCYLNLQYFNLQLKLIYTIFWSTCHQIYKSFLLCRH